MQLTTSIIRAAESLHWNATSWCQCEHLRQLTAAKNQGRPPYEHPREVPQVLRRRRPGTWADKQHRDVRDKVDQSSRPLLLAMDERGNTGHRHSSLDNWIIPFRRLTKYYPILIAKQKANATHSLNQSSLKDPVYIQQLLGCMTGQWPFGDGFLRKINSLLFRFLWVLQEWATDVYKIKGCKQQT